MDWQAALPYIVALGGGTGLGAGLKALTDTIMALRAGVSARDGKRRDDIIAQRDEAVKAVLVERERSIDQARRADREQNRADWAERNMLIAKHNEQRAREHAAELRVALMERGHLTREELPDWPEMEQTIPRSRLTEIQAQMRKGDDYGAD